MYIMVSKNSIQADLTRLRPFTVYSVQVAAFGSEDGNFTSPLIVKTWEGGRRKICAFAMHCTKIETKVKLSTQLLSGL